MLTRDDLLEEIVGEGRYTFISTGMSVWGEIDHAVEIFRKHRCPFELMHCNSTYPMEDVGANLALIPALREKYGCKVGYSGHERGIRPSVLSVAAGAGSIERHITLDKSMYGSDQKASIEPEQLRALVREVRQAEAIVGNGEKILSPEEKAVRAKLRG